MDTNDRYIDATINSTSTSSNHTLDIIRAAFPYLDSESQESMGLVLKTGELIESFQAIKKDNTMSTLSIRKQKQSIDIEALLNGIRNVCYQKEKEFIDIILNFYKAKNLYSTYSTLASTMASQKNNTDNLGSMFGMEGDFNIKDIMETFLTPEQKSTFDNLNMMFSVMQ